MSLVGEVLLYFIIPSLSLFSLRFLFFSFSNFFDPYENAVGYAFMKASAVVLEDMARNNGLRLMQNLLQTFQDGNRWYNQAMVPYKKHFRSRIRTFWDVDLTEMSVHIFFNRHSFLLFFTYHKRE